VTFRTMPGAGGGGQRPPVEHTAARRMPFTSQIKKPKSGNNRSSSKTYFALYLR
jgi:hypothetical protein